MRLHSSFQSDNLLIEHYELFRYHHVFVVVSEKPVLESASLSNLIEKVCQGIPLEQPAAECVLNAAGGAVGGRASRQVRPNISRTRAPLPAGGTAQKTDLILSLLRESPLSLFLSLRRTAILFRHEHHYYE